MKKLVALLLACMLILAAAAAMAEPSGTVMLYSSLKEKQLVAVKEAFEAKYPGIVMDYYQAGTGKNGCWRRNTARMKRSGKEMARWPRICCGSATPPTI